MEYSALIRYYPLIEYCALIALGYIIGSIPTGYILVKRFTGKNILEFGSGNIGSTNVKRAAGKTLSFFTLVLDIIKGSLPVLIYLLIHENELQYVLTNHLSALHPKVYAIALATILGHDFSIFLKFKGGKGVNTTLGATLLITPLPVVISVFVYFLVKWKFKYTSVGSLCIAITLPITQLCINGFSPTFYYLIVCMVLIIILHLQNIKRLLKNEELTS